MNSMPIDVWDLATFDDALLAELNSERDLLRDYALTETRQFLEREAADGWVPPKSNPYAGRRNGFVEHVIMPAMEQRTIRAWHYTRLTDDETAILKSGGSMSRIWRPSVEGSTFRCSWARFQPKMPTRSMRRAPFITNCDSRTGKFWMTSHPRATTDDSGVELLLEHWGGEGVYFWLRDEKLVELVKGVGRPRVIELAVPLRVTREAYGAAKAVVATLVRTLGCKPDWSDFDLYTTSAFGPEAVLKIHTEGEPDFAALARGYPAAFVDRER